METPKRKKGGYKRPRTKTPSLHSYAVKRDLWFADLPSLALAPISQTAPMLQPQKPLSEQIGELAGEIIWEALSAEWKKASPGSYALNRAIYEVAPHCGPEASGALNLGAWLTLGYGLKQIADRQGH
jgi:hypothetical protein